MIRRESLADTVTVTKNCHKEKYVFTCTQDMVSGQTSSIPIFFQKKTQFIGTIGFQNFEG